MHIHESELGAHDRLQTIFLAGLRRAHRRRCVAAHCPGACPAHCPLLRDQPLFFGINYTSKETLSSPDPAVRLPRLAEDIAHRCLVGLARLSLGDSSYLVLTNGGPRAAIDCLSSGWTYW